MSKLPDKFANPQNLGSGDINYYKQEVQRLKKLAVQEIDLDLIDLRENVRKEYKQETIEELAKSIEKYSLLNPIQLIRNGSRYHLLAGYRRYFAHKFLNRQTIKAILCEPESNEIVILQLVENIQREELAPYDLELSVQAFANEGYTYEEIAKVLNKSKSWVSQILSSKNIREKNMALLEQHRIARQLPPSTLVALTGLPEEDTKKILETVLASDKPVTQAEVKKQRKQLLEKGKPEDGEQTALTIKLLLKNDTLSAIIKSPGAVIGNDKVKSYMEKIIEFLKTLEIDIRS